MPHASIKDYGNLCIVDSDDSKLHQAIYELLSVKGEQLWFNSAYQNKKWDGYYRFYNKRNQAFPSGLAFFVKKRFPNIPVISMRQQKCDVEVSKIHELTTITPRDDQLKAVKTALQLERGIVQWPTGAGKTIGIAMLCNAVRGKILILVHTKNLLIQTADTLERELSEPIAKVGAGRYDEERVTVGIVASIVKLPQEYLNDFDMVILDEAHHASANTFYKTLIKCPAYFRYGFSADPLDEHKVKSNSKYKQYRIMGCFGPLISQTSVADMKAKGVIATPTIKFVKLNHSYQQDDEDLNYQEAYCKYICENAKLHDKVTYLCKHYANKTILIIVKHIHHGKALKTYLDDNNLDSAFLHGEEPTKLIQETIQKFRERKLDILIGSPIFNEGVDIPNVDVLVMAASDVAATKQRLGRSLRKKAQGDNVVKVFDFYITGNKHIERHAKRRITIYQKEGHKII